MSEREPLPPGATARFGSRRFRTPGPIAQLAFSPDGRFLAAAGGHGVALLDPLDGALLLRLKGSDAGFGAVAFADRAGVLAAAGPREVRLWETREFSELRVIEPPRSGIQALALSPDGVRIFAGGRDRVGRVWDTTTGALCFELERAFNMGPSSAAYSPDGRWIATAGAYESIELWDAQSGQSVCAFGEPGFMPTTVAFSPDGRRILGASAKGRILVWDPALRVRRGQLDAHPEEITAVRFSPDNGVLLTAARDRTVKAWDAQRLTPIWSLAVLDEAPSIAVHADGGSLYVGGDRRAVQRLALATGERADGPVGHLGAVLEIAVRDDGSEVVSAGSDGAVFGWDAAAAEVSWTLPGAAASSVALAEDASVVAVVDRGCAPPVLRVTELPTRRVRAEVDPGSARRAVPSRGGDGVAVVTNFGSVRLLDGALGQSSEVRTDAEDVAWSHDGALLLTRTRRSALRLFDVAGPSERHRLTCSKVECMALSRDGDEVHASGSTGVLHRWSARDGKELARARVSTLEVSAVARSPDGALVAVGSHDGAVKLCDAASCEVIGAVLAHDGAVRALRFAPDGRGLLSGGEDGLMVLWAVEALRGAEIRVVREPKGRKARGELPSGG